VIAPVEKRVTMVVAESFADGYAPFSHATGLARALSKKGYQLSLIAEDTGPYHKNGLFARLKRFYRINRKALAALSQSDLVLARGHFAHFPWVLVARMRGIPVMHEMNGQVYDAAITYRWLAPLQWILTTSYQSQLRSSIGVACITAEIAENIRSHAPSIPLKVIGNGVDQEIFYPRQKDADNKNTDANPPEPFVIFPSSLTAWHGVSTLLDAIKHPAWPKNLNVAIVGDGVQSQIVKEAAAVDSRIHHMSLLKQQALANLMRKASLGLCLIDSLSERGLVEVLPLKLFEMMASELAVVASDVPGQSGVITQTGAGVLVPPKDPAELAKTVAAIFESDARTQMGQLGRKAVLEQYCWDHRAEEYCDFIAHTLAPTKLA
jgi:glycosyltransferase involved in cell wall biosynthesis